MGDPLNRLNLDFAMDLPDHSTPLEAVAVIKVLDKDGDLALAVRTTAGLTEWECVGMLTAALDAARKEITESFDSENEE